MGQQCLVFCLLNISESISTFKCLTCHLLLVAKSRVPMPQNMAIHKAVCCVRLSPVGASVVLRVPAQRQPPVAQHHHLQRHTRHRPQLVPQPGLHAHYSGSVPATDQRPQRRPQVHGAAAGAPLWCPQAHPGGR